MNIQVTSHVLGKQELTGNYQVEPSMGIVPFVESLGLVWNLDALVVINDTIAKEEDQLQEGDHIHLLIPILGG